MLQLIFGKIEGYFRARFERKYREAGFQFVYTGRHGITTYVHWEKLFDIIETNAISDAEPMLEALSDKLQGGGVVLDVGANIGIVSVWFARRADLVYSFEPDPANVALLKRNLELNAVSNVQVCEVAVSKQAGEADFYVRESFVHHGLQSKHLSRVTRTTKVATVTLDRFCAEKGIGEVSVLKLDIEGGELDALMGFKEHLAAGKVKMVVFEHAPALMGKQEAARLEVFNFLAGFGYEIYNLSHEAVSAEQMARSPHGDFYAVIG